ncbi:MAG: aldolase/citrate lyase family protein [Chloroflexi bacterium]|nr:aldolase/citrate lyase family protein [Chloroflexota bacterium]
MPELGNLKRRLQAGEVVVGPFVIIPSVPLVDTLGYAGMDFCIIDTEHGPISQESATDLVIAAQGTGVAPIIRVGGNDERLILRSLDIGADGVQVPQINNVDDANRVVHAAKYSPMGERGMSVFTRAGDYYVNEGKGHTDKQNEETMIVVHIEGQRGLNNLDEIMTVEGIDVLFLGPYDISQSLGMPGEVRSPKVEQALKEAAGKARAKGRAVGSYAKDVEMGKWLIDLGVQYLSINVDATIYMQACASIARALK